MTKSGLAQKVYQVVKEIESGGNTPGDQLTIFLLEDPQKAGLSAAEVSVEFILGLKHILLPATIGEKVKKFAFFMNELCKSSTTVWSNFLYPKMEAIEVYIAREEWQEAFGFLFAIQMFATLSEHNNWVIIPEAWQERKWKCWWGSFSVSWRRVLEQSDSVLGLSVPAGRPGGYRQQLCNILANFEQSVNTLFGRTFGLTKMRIRIVSEPESDDEVMDEDINGNK